MFMFSDITRTAHSDSTYFQLGAYAHVQYADDHHGDSDPEGPELHVPPRLDQTYVPPFNHFDFGDDAGNVPDAGVSTEAIAVDGTATPPGYAPDAPPHPAGYVDAVDSNVA